MENHPIYSAEITEIIGTPPRWIMRVGSGLLLLLLLVFIGLSNSIAIPETSYSNITIRAATQPYYVTQAMASRVVVAPGQVVEQGQPLARSAADTAICLRAPFRGTIFYEGPTKAQPGDTLAVLVPLATTYGFSGKVAVSQLSQLQHRGEVELAVPLADRSESSLSLKGRLSYVNPVVHNGTATYKGHLDSASAAVLAHQLAFATSLDGTLLVSRRHQTLLNRIFN